jgi:hypothetical protein
MDKKIIIGFCVLIIVIVIIILLVIFNKDNGHKVIMNNHKLFYDTKQILVGNENFKESLYGNKYSLSFWIKTNNIPRNASWDSTTESSKIILFKDGSPNVYFKFPNTIRIQLKYKDNDGGFDEYNFDFDLYESQKWNNFILVVNNRNIKVYKNKLLVMSKFIDNVPWISKKMMSIGKSKQNFFGYTGFIDYFNYALSKNQIIELYQKRKKKLPKYLMNYKQYLEKDK